MRLKIHSLICMAVYTALFGPLVSAVWDDTPSVTKAWWGSQVLCGHAEASALECCPVGAIGVKGKNFHQLIYTCISSSMIEAWHGSKAASKLNETGRGASLSQSPTLRAELRGPKTFVASISKSLSAVARVALITFCSLELAQLRAGVSMWWFTETQIARMQEIPAKDIPCWVWAKPAYNV